MDCVDSSDEQECRMVPFVFLCFLLILSLSLNFKVIMDTGYKKTITPVPVDGAGDGADGGDGGGGGGAGGGDDAGGGDVGAGGGDLPVNLSLTILDILHIDEMKEIFTAKISLRRDWMDRRLTYKNLKKENSNKNDLSKEEAESIWYPSVFINNIENSEKVKPTDIENQARVIPDKNFSYSFKNNGHFFKGSENKLTLTKQWTVEFVCHYAMHWYPFDTQVVFLLDYQIIENYRIMSI